METVKLVAEVVTAVSAALLLFEKYCGPVKDFLKRTLPAFLFGCKDLKGKRHMFFSGVKVLKENDSRQHNINQGLLRDVETEEILVLDKEMLSKFLTESGIFKKSSRRVK